MDEQQYLNYLVDLHSGTGRQGPGSPEWTQKALSMLPAFCDTHRILDVGCGTGASTAVLWQHTEAQITAVDFFDVFLADLDIAVKKAGVSERVNIMQGDMNDLPFEPGSFDAVWSEGAIFVMGFENGIKTWRPLLKPGGIIAVSELCWTAEAPPKPCVDYWQATCPTIVPVSKHLEMLQRQGYETIGHFILPKSAWQDEYYRVLRQRIGPFREKWKDNPDALQIATETEKEMKIHDEYGDFYSYAFYLARRV